jgi:lipoprotein-anchoring transpeptidase ErfK/SrfK
VLLVTGARASRRNGLWYRVQLPSRPNGSSAWLPAQIVQLNSTPYRLRVVLGARRIELYRAGKVIGRWPVAVGTPQNPTPTGLFAISEVVRQGNPNAFYGPYIITLTAHSPGLSDFDGGDGRVALHGTSLPSLLGQAVSHGCVRMPNTLAERLGLLLPPGTPVRISA